MKLFSYEAGPSMNERTSFPGDCSNPTQRMSKQTKEKLCHVAQSSTTLLMKIYGSFTTASELS